MINQLLYIQFTCYKCSNRNHIWNILFIENRWYYIFFLFFSVFFIFFIFFVAYLAFVRKCNVKIMCKMIAEMCNKVQYLINRVWNFRFLEMLCARGKFTINLILYRCNGWCVYMNVYNCNQNILLVWIHQYKKCLRSFLSW